MVATTMRRTTSSATELSHTTRFIVGCPHPTMSRNQWERWAAMRRSRVNCAPHSAVITRRIAPARVRFLRLSTATVATATATKTVISWWHPTNTIWNCEVLCAKKDCYKSAVLLGLNSLGISRRVKTLHFVKSLSIGMIITMSSALFRDMSTDFDQPGPTTRRKTM